MEVNLPYGSEIVKVKVPKESKVEVLNPKSVGVLPDPKEAVIQAISSSVDLDFDYLLKDSKKISVIIDDVTRKTPTKVILPLLLEKLREHRISKDQINIVIALGSHRPMTEKEIKQKVGEEIFKTYQIINSEFRDKSKMSSLGFTDDGIEIWVDKRVVQSDLKIGIGNIVPHPAVGWSGGGKIIYPGVAGEDTVARFHFLHGSIPWNMYGQEDNPVRIEMEKWVNKVGLHFIVNTILTPAGDIYGVVGGDYVKAHRKGVEIAKHVYGIKTQSLFDIVVVSSYPADVDFWQATKGVLAGDHILEDGGILILFTPCYEGVGPHPEYLYYCGYDSPDNLLEEIKNFASEEMLTASVGITISRIAQRKKLFLVSGGIGEEEAKVGGFEYFYSLEDALREALRLKGENARIGFVPYGGETFAYTV